jgi:hypothetical protein
MPSPVKGNRGTGFYRRKGGAWKKSPKGHSYKKVGYGNGDYSKRSVKQDRQFRARKSRKNWEKYPQHYDNPR